VPKQERTISAKMGDNALNVLSQLFVSCDGHRFAAAPAMASQIKSDRSISSSRKIASDMNVSSRVFPKPVNENQAFAATGIGIPDPAEQTQPVLRLYGFGRISLH